MIKEKSKEICGQLKIYFNKLGIKQKDIAERLGVSAVQVNILMNGRQPFGKVAAMRWAEEFGLSAIWLMTGEGNMLQSGNEGEVIAPNVYLAPLIGKYAYAGVTHGWGDNEYLDTLPKYPFVVDHDPHGQYYAIEVRGDSMDDGTDRSIKEGSICLCRYISPELYQDASLHYNRWVFAIVTTDGILLKRITHHDINAGTITISSNNPAYADQTIMLDDVKAIMNVVQVSHTPTL